jgi:hypothetical protein
MTNKIYIKWEDLNFKWEDINMLWEDISIIQEVGNIIRKHGGGYAAYVEGNPWDKTRKEIGEEKTKKFIKIFCKVNDLDYERVVESNSKIKVTASQFEKVFNEAFKGVKVDF